MRTIEGIKGVRKRQDILRFIITYTQQHGYAPTYREIANSVGLRSLSSVQNHIEVLKRQGLIETDEDSSAARAIRVVGYMFIKVEESSRVAGERVK